MVDWEVVERLRSKGWDWDRIAADPKVGFQAEEGAGDSGRALRVLYYQRRSKAKRRPSGSGKDGGAGAIGDLPTAPKWGLARAGYLLTPMFGLWALIAFVYPSPVGVVVPAIPLLAFLVLVSAAVLSFGLLRASEKWSPTFRNTAIIGAVVGLIISGGFGAYGVAAGCPSLSSSVVAEPGQWEKAPNAAWTAQGEPKVFFYGSIACPYCSASSWAIAYALERFGVLTGTQYGYSNVNDNPSHIPETILAYTSLQSSYVSWDVAESTDDSQITTPGVAGCTEQAFVSTYDNGGSIPFFVVGGTYIHVGSFVDPTQLAGMTTQQVQGQVSNQSGTAWNAISTPAWTLEAFLLKADGGAPSSVANDPNVAAIYSQIH